MIKKQPYGDTVKDQLRAAVRDKLFRFMLDNGNVRGAILHGTRMINEMRANHELGILETMVLGRAYLGAGLLSAQLKGQERMRLQVECNGPIKGLVAETNAYGDVRGYLHNVPIPVDKPLEDFDLELFFGQGVLSVTRYLEDAKHPFTGKITLDYGNLALDLANYFLTSEQVPTAFNLSIQLDAQGDVIGAGGLFLQAMPAVSEQTIIGIEERVRHFPSMGRVFADNGDPVRLIGDVFKAYAPAMLENYRVEFMCHCNESQIRSILWLLPYDDLKELAATGPFPVEIRCHHCNSAYLFDQSTLQELYLQRFAHN